MNNISKVFMNFYLVLIPISFVLANSDDFGTSNSDHKVLTPDNLKKRLEVYGEVFVLDTTGEKLLWSSEEKYRWKASSNSNVIDSNWGLKDRQLKPIALHHHWEILKDGRIHVTIEQFDNWAEGKDHTMKSGKLLKKEDFILKDFSSYNWTSVLDNDKQVILRFRPELEVEDRMLEISDLPIAGSNIIVWDQAGNVWAKDFNLGGKYLALITHQGAVFMSYFPFEGAKKMGTARGNRIAIDVGNKMLTIQSQDPFLPSGTEAKIFAIYRPNLKTSRLNSVQSITYTRESEFVKRLKEVAGEK